MARDALNPGGYRLTAETLQGRAPGGEAETPGPAGVGHSHCWTSMTGLQTYVKCTKCAREVRTLVGAGGWLVRRLVGVAVYGQHGRYNRASPILAVFDVQKGQICPHVAKENGG